MGKRLLWFCYRLSCCAVSLDAVSSHRTSYYFLIVSKVGSGQINSSHKKGWHTPYRYDAVEASKAGQQCELGSSRLDIASACLYYPEAHVAIRSFFMLFHACILKLTYLLRISRTSMPRTFIRFPQLEMAGVALCRIIIWFTHQ